MSDYTKITDYAAKDALTTGDPAKLVKGTEIGADFDAVATAVATKADKDTPTFIGTITAAIANFSGLVTAALGLTVSGGAFNSRGITDNATAKVITLSGSGANSIAISNSSSSPKIAVSGSGNLVLSGSTAGNVVEFLASGTASGACSFTNATTGTLGAITVTNAGVFGLRTYHANGFNFTTNNGSTQQVSITHTAAADRYITLTGSNGANPTVSVSAGSLAVGSSLTMLQSNLGAFAAGEWSRDSNWGTYYKAPSTGTVADIGLHNNAGTAGWGLTAKGAGYTGGSGGSVTQASSRTTGVTLNKPCGSITLVSAAGSTSWQTFTVTNSFIEANDVVIVNQRDGTDLNEIHVTDVSSGAFNISFKTTGGTTTESPIFNFVVIKSVVG